MKTFRFSLMLIIAAAVIVGMDNNEAHALDTYKCSFTCRSLPNNLTFVCAGSQSAATPLCKANPPGSSCTHDSTVYEVAGCTKKGNFVSGLPETPTLQPGGLITKPGVPTLKPPVFQGGLTPQGN